MTKPLPTFEIVDIEGFADRMGISRTTVFEWIKNGTLQPGRHYIKIGRVIRFSYGQELIQILLEDSKGLDQVANDSQQQEKPTAVKNVRQQPTGATINPDYR